MKKLLITLLFVAPLFSYAQGTEAIKAEAEKLKKEKLGKDTVVGWKYNGFMNFNFSQTSLNNWAAGGKSAIATLGTVNFNANYRNKKFRSFNTLNMNYGTIKQNGDPVEKNDDRIEVISNNGYKAVNNLYYSALASFRTQFHATFKENVLVSNFMAPAWLQASLGLNYTKNDNFSVVVAPIAGKFTFVNDQQLADSGAYGVEGAIIDPLTFQVLTPGKRIRTEVGAYFYMTAKVDIMKNITLSTRLDLFNNYTDKNVDNRKNIDVNWETNINMKVNKYISASLFTHLIYDQDIPIDINLSDGSVIQGPRTQFKQVLGVGLSYKF
ncbi:MAG: DUF3078 domain-containing protein [Bacteroidetes bacterium]|nr:MAG: DUF3078 domain-containing protein [Bacteroidota bacterium]